MSSSIEQRRAASALACVRGETARPDKGRYASYVEALPAAIYANGIGQAIATELARPEESHQRLAAHVALWLCGNDECAPYRGILEMSRRPAAKDQAMALLDALTQGNERSYLRAQSEALAFLVWLKKLSRALLPRDDTA
jgi:CRISPR-associated protein Cmr5